MVSLTAISGAMAALQSAKDIVTSLVNLRDASIASSKIIDLQLALMDVQQQVFNANQERTALIERVADLEKQIVQMEEWETEKEKYSLTEIAPSVFAYARKEPVATGEPSHKICTNCYQSGKKSILQHENTGACKMLHCHACRSSLIISGRQPSPSGPLKSKIMKY